MLKLFSRDRYLAGNLCLILFLAFLVSLAVTGLPTAASGATSIGVDDVKKVDQDQVPQGNYKFVPVVTTATQFATVVEGLIKYLEANRNAVDSVVYQQTYSQVYSQIYGTVYGNIYQYVLYLVYSEAPDNVTVVYFKPPAIWGIDETGKWSSITLEVPVPVPKSTGGGGDGGGVPSPPPTTPTPSTPTSFGTVAWDKEAGTGTVAVNAQKFADQVRQAQQAGQATVDLRVTPPAEVALKALTLEAPAQAVLAAATAGVGMVIGTPDLYVTFDPAKLPPDLKAQFEAKPNAVLSFTFNVLSAEEARQAAVVPADYRLAGSVAVVQLAFDGQALPGTLTLSYGGAVTGARSGLFAALDLSGLFRGQKLAALTLDEDKLGLYRYNEATRTWEYLGGRVDKATKTVAARVAALSQAKYAVMAYEKTFADLLGHWAKRDVEIMAARHIAGGVSETLFAPNGKVTRAQFAALLIRTLGISEAKPAASGFADVAASDWYFGAVETARAAGLVGGYPDGTFRPEAAITREEMAAMVCRALGYAGKKPVLGQPVEVLLARFSDAAQIGTWAREAVAAAVSENILRGRDGQAAPKANATRAEATVMLKRALVSLGEVSE